MSSQLMRLVRDIKNPSADRRSNLWSKAPVMYEGAVFLHRTETRSFKIGGQLEEYSIYSIIPLGCRGRLYNHESDLLGAIVANAEPCQISDLDASLMVDLMTEETGWDSGPLMEGIVRHLGYDAVMAIIKSDSKLA